MLNSTASSEWRRPEARLLSFPDAHILLQAGIDPAALPILLPKLESKAVLIRNVKLFAANILKQSMLSAGGDVAVHRLVISGKCEYSDCVVMGDTRHYNALLDKLYAQPYMSEIAAVIRKALDNRNEPGIKLKICSNTVEWKSKPVIMGIVNVTKDSFSDGGKFIDSQIAVEHALKLAEQGADIIDIGGESTRPGAAEIDEATEIRRIIPVIKGVKEKSRILISVDTSKASVASAAVDAGAVIINDVSAMTRDSGMIKTVKDSGAAVILMHMRGTPASMQNDTNYEDIVSEVYSYLKNRVESCIEAGIDPSSIIVDPGIGFGKDADGNLSLIRHISEFSSIGMPVLLGHSRKSFIGKVLDAEVYEREEGTDAVTTWAALRDVDFVRVHDVKRAKTTIDMIRAIKKSR